MSTRSATTRRPATRRCSRRRGLFLERLGLNSLSDLPALADFVPEASIVEALERGLLLSSVNAQLAADASDDEEAPEPDAPASDDIELDVTGEQ